MVYILPKSNYTFPHPDFADNIGLLAIGGDLCEQRLLLAYTMGIFPWYNEGEPILWWSPNPRMVLFPSEFHISKSLKKTIKKKPYEIKLDFAFNQVVQLCADVHRKKSGGTWIVTELQNAYSRLHQIGYAHSVECWHEGNMVGGLFGVSIGKAFFAESMFSLMSNASKVALSFLSVYLQLNDFHFIDCQMPTDHLKSLGAKPIERNLYLNYLKKSLTFKSKLGCWH